MKIRKYLPVVISLITVACSSDNNRTTEEGNIYVYDTREILQCSSGVITPAESAQLLINNGIDVISSSCGHVTGQAYIAVCGAPSAKIIAHEIRIENLEAAEEVGFQDVESLIDEANDVNYELYECTDT